MAVWILALAMPLMSQEEGKTGPFLTNCYRRRKKQDHMPEFEIDTFDFTVTTVPVGNSELMENDRFLEEPINSDELQLRNLNPSIISGNIALGKEDVQFVEDSPENHKDKQQQQHEQQQQQQQQKSNAETEEEIAEEFDTILKDVLLTLRDHPEIVKDILDEEEDAEMSLTSPQLETAPKTVVKKAGWKQYVPKFSKEFYPVKSKESDSSEENYYKMKYGSPEDTDSSESREIHEVNNEDKSSSSGEDSKSSEEEKYSNSDSSSEERHSRLALKGHKSQNLLSRNFHLSKAAKRRPEEYEPTIDLTSLPEEGGQHYPLDAGTKRKNETNKASSSPGQDSMEFDKGQLLSGFQNPFMNPLPLLEPNGFQPVKDVEQTVKLTTKAKTPKRSKDEVKNTVRSQDKGNGVSKQSQKRQLATSA